MRCIRKLFALTGLVALLCAYGSPVAAQTSVTTTTLTNAVTAVPTTLVLGAVTNVAVGGGLFIDKEYFLVNSVNTTTLQVGVSRGYSGTSSAPHAAAATVYVGPTSGVPGGGPFQHNDPAIGSCATTQWPYNYFINVDAGRVWQCTGGQWMNVIDAYQWVSPTACNSSISANATGTNGYTILGTAPSIPVVQAQTDNTATAHVHYYTCSIPVPSRTNVVKASYLVDVEFYYGVQTTALPAQVAVLASGTMNAKTVFQKIAYPAAGLSETATGLAEAARADAGTLLITPVVASFNGGTTTAGEFFNIKFTPATPFALATDRTQYLLTVSLLNSTTVAQITNSPGFLVHYRTLQAGF